MSMFSDDEIKQLDTVINEEKLQVTVSQYGGLSNYSIYRKKYIDDLPQAMFILFGNNLTVMTADGSVEMEFAEEVTLEYLKGLSLAELIGAVKDSYGSDSLVNDLPTNLKNFHKYVAVILLELNRGKVQSLNQETTLT